MLHRLCRTKKRTLAAGSKPCGPLEADFGRAVAAYRRLTLVLNRTLFLFDGRNLGLANPRPDLTVRFSAALPTPPGSTKPRPCCSPFSPPVRE